MEKIQFSITIDAPKEKVWEALWQDAHYRNWTSVFGEGSYAITDNWKEGTKVLFLAADGGGMVSMVEANRPGEYMSFKHIGEMKDGVEDTSSEKIKEWAGSMENYTLTEEDGKTTLDVDMGITEAYKEFFINTWPIALQKLKEIAEKK